MKKQQNIEELKLNKKKKNNLKFLDNKNQKRKQRKNIEELIEDDEYLEDVERFLNKIL